MCDAVDFNVEALFSKSKDLIMSSLAVWVTILAERLDSSYIVLDISCLFSPTESLYNFA